MSVRISVKDSSNRPVENATVHVSWLSGGYSRGETNSTGIFDTKVSGPSTANFIMIDGKEVDKNVLLDDRTYAYSKVY